MRSLQDIYIRTLHRVYANGNGGILTIFLHPELAGYKVKFISLDRSTLSFQSYTKTDFKSRLRTSLSGRVVRIAFEKLNLYAKKDFGDRKLCKDFQDGFNESIENIIALAAKFAKEPRIVMWRKALFEQSAIARQSKLIELLQADKDNQVAYPDFEKLMHKTFDTLGASSKISG